MKLTQRQLDKIAGLIDEEAKVRNELHESMYSNRKNSVLNESLMFEDRGSLKELPQSFVSDIDDDVNAYVQEQMLSKIRSKIFKSLSEYMRLSGYNMTPGQWHDELEGFDVHYESEMELMTDIREAILKYAKDVIEAAVMAIGPDEEPSKEDLEPRYSEYE
jgi:hypothetical protein